MGSDVTTVGQVGNLTREDCRDAALYVAEAAIDGRWTDELRDQLEMLGLIQPRQPPPTARRRWGGGQP